MPALAAAVTAAPLAECAWNMLVSMPTFPIIDLSHLATVYGVTGLCGLITPKNNMDWASEASRSILVSPECSD